MHWDDRLYIQHTRMISLTCIHMKLHANYSHLMMCGTHFKRESHMFSIELVTSLYCSFLK